MLYNHAKIINNGDMAEWKKVHVHSVYLISINITPNNTAVNMLYLEKVNEGSDGSKIRVGELIILFKLDIL